MRLLFSIVTVILTLIGSVVNAQDNIGVGFLLGPNFAWGAGNRSYFESTGGLGYSFGGLMTFRAQKNLGVEIQMVYSLNQAEYRFEESDLYYTAVLKGTQTMTFVDMPILAVYHRENAMFDKIKFGVMPSWGMSARTKATYREEDQYDFWEDRFSGDNDQIFSLSDISLTAGVEMKLSQGLGLDVRYVYGLKNLLDESSDLKIRRNVILVALIKTM